MFRTLFTTLKAKILTGYIVVILIMIGVMFWSLYNFNRLNESFRSIIVQNYSSIVAADNMVRSLDDQTNALFMIIDKENPAHGEKLFQFAKQDFFFWFEKAREAANTPDQITFLDSLNDQYRVFLSEISSVVNNSFIYSNPAEKNQYVQAINLISNIKSKCYHIFETNHNFISRADERVQSITRIAAFTMLFLAILGTVISLVFSTKFSNFIVKPVSDLTRSVKYVAAGNFDQEIQTDDSDEIGILADEFNSMVGKLKKYEELNINKILYEKRKSDVIIESINDPVLMVNSSMEILLANKAFKEDFGNLKSEKVFLNEVIKDEKIYKDIKKYVTSASSINSDEDENVLRIIDTNGRVRFYKIRYSSIILPESDINAALIVFSDITKYEELDRLKSEFVAKVSHELKTPLTSMGMAIGILEDGVVGELSIKQKELIFSMKEDYDRLNRLVKEILELSRIESGGIQLNFEALKVNPLIEECIKSFSLQCKEKKISLNYSTDKMLPPILADYDYLIRAIGNFIGNSIKFTDKGGDINVNASAKNGNVIITISDTGTGISPEYIDKIFDKFVQVSGSRPGSVGLGLTIAKEIIELHKGSINVYSEPGVGSKFEIILPVRRNE